MTRIALGLGLGLGFVINKIDKVVYLVDHEENYLTDHEGNYLIVGDVND